MSTAEPVTRELSQRVRVSPSPQPRRRRPRPRRSPHRAPAARARRPRRTRALKSPKILATRRPQPIPPMPPRSSGERSDRHQAIMLMNEEELHSKFPETGVRPLLSAKEPAEQATVAPPLSDRVDGFQQRHARKGPREEGAQGGPAHLHLWRQERCESRIARRLRAVAYKAPPPPPTQESSTSSTSGTGPARSCPRRTT